MTPGADHPATKLARALQQPSYSRPENRDREREVLRSCQALARELFPRAFARMSVRAPDPYRLELVWEGASAGAEETDGERAGRAGGDDGANAPVLCLAHYDVVPAGAESWRYPPFSGELADGAVWGRGAIDNKLSWIAMLQAAEELLAEGFSPCRPIYFAFGGDEEVGGDRGAGTFAREYRGRGLSFAAIIDEGAIVARGVMAGIATPVGLIGCGEKGHLNVRVSARARAAGHASNPPRHQAAGDLAWALARLTRRPQPAQATPAVRAFIHSLGSVFGGARGLLLKAYPASALVVHAVLARTPETDAMLRTTAAVTMLGGSETPNVLPHEVWANLNLRLLPGTTIDEILAQMRRRVTRKRRRRGRHISVELAGAADTPPDTNEAPAESPVGGRWYRAIERTIREVWGAIPVLPYLVTATTDSRHYAGLSDSIYRFVPMELTPADLAGIHGVDEHIDVENVERAVSFYKSLFREIGRGCDEHQHD